jgi:signal transduction histidine kinase
MKKIRWTLLALAIGIALPAVLIVERAISSLELERAVRHEAVAERIFDEMERSLSEFLVREESRPASDYRPVDAGGASDARTATTSRMTTLDGAAFENSDEPFIVGWFSLDSNGKAQSYVRREAEASRVSLAIDGLFGPRAGAKLSASTPKPASPTPGRTQAFEFGTRRSASLGKGKDALEQDDLATAKPEESNAYDVLQRLNRGLRLRSERQEKALQKSAGGAAASAGAYAARDAAAPSVFESLVSAPHALSPPASQLAEQAEQESVDERKEKAAVSFRPNIDPMIGRASGTGELVLTRSIWQGARVERQGLVLDRVALVSWLEERVLEESGLSNQVKIDFNPTPVVEPESPDLHRYLHRFAEPFDELFARLDLPSLPDLGSERPIYALALLLAFVAIIGLLVVDRMTVVVVDFAERRSDFVAAVSHELKTPLTAIRMYGEMLRDGLVSSPEKRSEYYNTITDESERLSRLIDNVLEFSKLGQNQREVRLVVGSLPDAVREAAQKLQAHVEREGFALEFDLDDTLPPVQFDRDAVTQLLFNLVDNALKYAGDAQVRKIEIGLALREGRLELSVRDHGPGVPGDQLRRIFEPFYRIGEELTRTAKGTGIGLALVKELAESMNAAVSGRNAAGGGLEVCVAFETSA